MRAFLQSVPARVGAWWGGRRGQGDSGRVLHWIIHGQDQTGPPDRHFVFRQGEVVIQTFVRRATRGVLAVDGAGSGCVCADGDVSVHGAHVGVIQDEVRVVIVKLPFILVCGKGGGSREEKKRKARE